MWYGWISSRGFLEPFACNNKMVEHSSYEQHDIPAWITITIHFLAYVVDLPWHRQGADSREPAATIVTKQSKSENSTQGFDSLERSPALGWPLLASCSRGPSFDILATSWVYPPQYGSSSGESKSTPDNIAGVQFNHDRQIARDN